MSDLLLLGAGGHGRVIAETALATGRFNRISFLDDRCCGPGQLPDQLGCPVIGPLSAALDPHIRQQFSAAIVAIGNAALRVQWLPSLATAGYEVPALVHPTACVSPSAQLGVGSVVFAQACIQAQAIIGSGAILNTSCSLDHDAQLGNGVHVCPGAHLAGEVQVGNRSWIGIGA
ncbi:acetyltransferase, partial [Synechococcus sp. MIT S9504]